VVKTGNGSHIDGKRKVYKRNKICRDEGIKGINK
jgi:hypothetical protein